MNENLPCIITVAITGSVPKKIDNPTIPITVSEQIESTRKCYYAGASIFHLHVRNEDESPSSDVNKFKELLVGIEESCPNIIIQFSTGGGGRSQEERWEESPNQIIFLSRNSFKSFSFNPINSPKI